MKFLLVIMSIVFTSASFSQDDTIPDIQLIELEEEEEGFSPPHVCEFPRHIEVGGEMELWEYVINYTDPILKKAKKITKEPVWYIRIEIDKNGTPMNPIVKQGVDKKLDKHFEHITDNMPGFVTLDTANWRQNEFVILPIKGY
jgi:hypothetical protein